MPIVILTGMAEKEDHFFASHCVELGIASCGDTIEEDFDMLEESIEVYLEALVDIGTLEREILECGVTVRENMPCESEEFTVSAVLGKFYRIYVVKIPVSETR